MKGLMPTHRSTFPRRLGAVAIAAALAFALGANAEENPAMARADSHACAASKTLSTCMGAPKEESGACVEGCIRLQFADIQEASEQEQRTCIRRYIADAGRTPARCTLAGAVDPPPAAPSSAEVATAVRSGERLAVDALGDRLRARLLSLQQGSCTKACAHDAPLSLAAVRQAPALIAQYKRCMMTADSTREARKLAAYERDLYCDYLRKADGRCRDASKCDLLEEGSDQECRYASPGVGMCGL